MATSGADALPQPHLRTAVASLKAVHHVSLDRSSTATLNGSKTSVVSTTSSSRSWRPSPSLKWAIGQFRAFFVEEQMRVAHSIKVGLALALVSLTVLLRDVYEWLGHTALVAILTAVVVIFETRVGATLTKGLCNGLATILAAALGLIVDHFSDFSGANVEPYIVALSVFVVGLATTYSTRFFPSLSSKYNYGVEIFLITFCLVVISGYRVPDSTDVVLDRMLTCLLGIAICLLVTLFVWPIWAGEELHNLIISNFEGLAGAVEECMKEYFLGVYKLGRVSAKICKGEPHEDPIYKGYRAVLISKHTEESLANFARCEPRHGRFGYSYPWKQCVQVGAILRHCAYIVSALHGCVLSEIQAPYSLRKVFSHPCMRISAELGKVLREIAEDLKNGRKSRSKECMMSNLKRTVEQLHVAVNAHPHLFVNLWPVVCKTTVEDKLHPTSMPVEKENHTPDQSILQLLPDGSIEGMLTDSCIDDMPMNGEEIISETMTKQGFRSHNCSGFAESLSFATVASLLFEITARLEHLLSAVAELEEQAGFKESDETMEPCKGRSNTDQHMVQHSSVLISD